MQRKVIIKRIVSENGEVIAETKSEVIKDDRASGTIRQSIRVNVSSNGSSSHMSGFSSVTSEEPDTSEG